MSLWFGDFELDPERRQLLCTGEPGNALDVGRMDGPRVAVDPRAERVAVSALSGCVVVVPVAGGEVRRFEGFSARTMGNIFVA